MGAIELFHALPAPLRDAAASVHGWRLARLRYGPETPELVREAGARERWGSEQWQQWQGAALERALHRAERVAFREGRPHGTVGPTLDALRTWPILSKQELRERGAAYRVPVRPEGVVEERTSGSTGTPLVVWWSKGATRRWYALVEARMRGWAGLTRRDPWAILGGRLVAPPGRQRPPYWVWNAGMQQLYLSSYHLSAGTVGDYLGATRQRGVRSLLGYPSAMASLAAFALEARIEGPKLEVAFSNAEPLSQRQRELISAAFHCPVRDSYGLAELVAGASECEAGSMHLWPEVGLVEILDDDDQPLAAGEVGRVVATGLINDAMALVRYDTGDLAALDPDSSPCPCGRTLPRIVHLDGRRDDVLITPDGRHVGRLDPAFKADLPIREAQIAQVAADRVVVRVVVASGWQPHHAAELRVALAARLGPSMAIEISPVAALPRTAAGKLRAVVRELEAPGG